MLCFGTEVPEGETDKANSMVLVFTVDTKRTPGKITVGASV